MPDLKTPNEELSDLQRKYMMLGARAASCPPSPRPRPRPPPAHPISATRPRQPARPVPPVAGARPLSRRHPGQACRAWRRALRGSPAWSWADRTRARRLWRLRGGPEGVLRDVAVDYQAEPGDHPRGEGGEQGAARPDGDDADRPLEAGPEGTAALGAPSPPCPPSPSSLSSARRCASSRSSRRPPPRPPTSTLARARVPATATAFPAPVHGLGTPAGAGYVPIGGSRRFLAWFFSGATRVSAPGASRTRTLTVGQCYCVGRAGPEPRTGAPDGEADCRPSQKIQRDASGCNILSKEAPEDRGRHAGP